MAKRKYNVQAHLDAYELEALFDLFNYEVIKNRQEAKFRFLAGEITQSALDWHLQHADWLNKLYLKLRPVPPKLRKELEARGHRVGCG
jgi:hypothetical protein